MCYNGTVLDSNENELNLLLDHSNEDLKIFEYYQLTDKVIVDIFQDHATLGSKICIDTANGKKFIEPGNSLIVHDDNTVRIVRKHQ